MIEVYPNLFVGDQTDELTIRYNPEWFIIHAAKEPYHRQMVGYVTRGAPKDSPEYYFAIRGSRMALNIIDHDNSEFAPPIEIIDAALNAIANNIDSKKILVHCNQGKSRSATIALLYLLKYTNELPNKFETIIEEFRKFYPLYSPSNGMIERIKQCMTG